jgi:hypothetical protein
MLNPVTSNLVLQSKEADHGQGGGGTSTRGRSDHKFFVSKISTAKSLRFKFLQSVFANPAPVTPFRGGEGGARKTRHKAGACLTKPSRPERVSMRLFHGLRERLNVPPPAASPGGAEVSPRRCDPAPPSGCTACDGSESPARPNRTVQTRRASRRRAAGPRTRD